jgi:hypothetical protein
MKGHSVSRRALIFVQSRDPAGETYIGAKMVDPIPRIGMNVTYTHEGTHRKARVADIRPSGWNSSSETVPTLRVLQDEP